MNAAIIAVGTELTSGQSVDTNSAWLSRRLGELGIETALHLTVDDEQARITDAIRLAAERAGVVIITGGLGPTPDDVTRQALANALGTTLQSDEASLSAITDYFERRNRPMSEINKVQAMLPVGCDVLANSCGTAPGIAARLGECEVYVTPGVPSEMRTMYDRQILPRLPGGGGVILQRMVRLFGTGESNVAEILADLLHRSGPVIVGTTVSSGLISVRITSRAKTVEQADRQARQIIDGVIDRMGEMVLGVGEVATMQSAVERLLMEYGQTIALAESCTGGKIAEMITDLPGASEYFRGGVVAYDNDIKIGQLAVPGELIERDGAVSQTVAAAMATNVRERFGSDWGIGVTGIAGPGGGTAEKPVGLVYTSLAGPDGVEVERHLMPGDRTRVRERSALAALNALRLKLLRTR